MHVIHHGGKNTVTGSCHELRFGHGAVLIDCGLFQGDEGQKPDIRFPTGHIRALVVTHSHIDHIGRIPWLLASGFTGPIYCTQATAELLPLMLEDGLKIQLNLDRGQRARILQQVAKQIHPLPYGQWHRVRMSTVAGIKQGTAESVLLRLQPAGHILGSAYAELKLADGRFIVFSGDLGPCNTPLLPDPKPPQAADVLYLESTYGNKHHEDVATRKERLNAVIQRSLTDGGAVIIPAFSLGRTQELLFDIEQLLHEQNLDGRLPVIIDSPLAAKITRFYRRYKKLWSREAKAKLAGKRFPLNFNQCVTVSDYRQHKALVSRLAHSGEACIVIAASGMCQGGRVMDYLKALLPDARTDVIFAGYQAKGTLGRMIQTGAETVTINRVLVEVNASVHTISGYSAHADRDELIRFVAGSPKPPGEIHLIHGEAEAKRELAEKLKAVLVGVKVVV